MPSCTSVHKAARNGDVDLISTLFNEGFALNNRNHYGDTPICVAAKHDQCAVIRLLHRFGVDVNVGNRYQASPLHCAALHGHVNSICELHALGGDIEAVDENGQTVLHTACLSGHVAVVELLIRLGCEVASYDEDGETALSVAAAHGYSAIVRILHHAGASVCDPDDYGLTPVHLAAEGGHSEVIELLHMLGADVDVRAYNAVFSALMPSVGVDFPPVVGLVLGVGSDDDGDDYNGKTPLLLAARGGHMNSVALLHKLGADLNSVCDYGCSPMLVAARNSRTNCMRYMLNYGVSVLGLSEDVRCSAAAKDVLVSVETVCARYNGSPTDRHSIYSTVKLASSLLLKVLVGDGSNPESCAVGRSPSVSSSIVRKGRGRSDVKNHKSLFEFGLSGYFLSPVSVDASRCFLCLPYKSRIFILTMFVQKCASTLFGGGDVASDFVLVLESLARLHFNRDVIEDVLNFRAVFADGAEKSAVLSHSGTVGDSSIPLGAMRIRVDAGTITGNSMSVFSQRGVVESYLGGHMSFKTSTDYLNELYSTFA